MLIQEEKELLRASKMLANSNDKPLTEYEEKSR
jgi:hypothetical protein